MKVREDERFNAGQVRFVPGLLASYIERDSWTKLNVKPSKIFQQDAVLDELFSHASKTAGDSSTAQVHGYLHALSKMFERGLLSKCPVYDVNCATMDSINEGFQYFVRWCHDCHGSSTVDKKQFLAWQTWDLLSLLICGARALVKDFVTRNPGYFIVLSRINGSVVESLFSQLKYSVGGKLTSLNYNNARGSVLVKSNCHAENYSNIHYRDEQLHLE